MLEEKAFQQRIQQIEELIARFNSVADPSLKDAARELAQLILDLHGAGLDRIMEIVSQAGEAGPHIVDRFGRDNLVKNLLLLHGLHPLDLEARVRQAIEKVRPSLRSHGAGVELVGVADGVVRLRLDGNLKGCGASGVKSAVEEAIYEAAPDLAALEIEGLTEAAPSEFAFVPLAKLMGANGSAQRGSN